MKQIYVLPTQIGLVDIVNLKLLFNKYSLLDYSNFFYNFASVTNRGALNKMAENIPSEPDPDNAGVGKRVDTIH